MPDFKLQYISILVGTALALTGCSGVQKAVQNQPDSPFTTSSLGVASQSQAPIDRWIVVLKPNANMTETAMACIKAGAKIKHRLISFNLLVLEIPYTKANATVSTIRQNMQVQRIDRDVYTQVIQPDNDQTTSQALAQSIPWGIDAVEADQVMAEGLYSGAGIKVAVLDSGIDLTHPDLATNIKGGINIADPSKNADDDHGHGTHCAGIIGAINNTIGVVGVAPQARLYAVKVINYQGWAYNSDIYAGLDWCIRNHMQVVSMSFGAYRSDLPPYTNAIYNEVIKITASYGLVLVGAAGNDFDKAVVAPACYDQVIAVSAMDQSYHITSWSSRGKEVDFIAPGKTVYSTVPVDLYPLGYASWNGTSMATPHVTGAAALVLQRYPGLTPAQVKAKLSATARNINIPVTEQGAGLINVYNAIH